MSEHDHDYDHPHAEIIHEAQPGYHDIMETAVRELLIEKQLFGPEEIRRQIEVLDSRTPALGAKVVARAWVDPEFRSRLLAPAARNWGSLSMTILSSSFSKIPTRCTTSSSARCALATRDPCWDCRRIGTI